MTFATVLMLKQSILCCFVLLMQLGDNALHLAAEGGQLDTVKYLCSHSRSGER